jgi:uncharacterized protein
MIGWWSGLFITVMLAVLEVSLSFDNAIINAKELTKMSPVWKKRFLTRGMIIAVFGMRIIFPLVIVSIVGHVGLFEAGRIALQDPEQYKHLIESSHITLAAFGWVFLLMVFLSFFLNEAKDIHWVAAIEKQLARVGKLESIEVIIALLVLRGTTHLAGFPHEETGVFFSAGIMGLITYLLVSGFSSLMQAQEKSGTGSKLFAGGFGTFMYLEILDASFSFDGVIGAFALTKNIIIIALGLGIGAMFVRSLTLMLVEKQTLSHYKYLEHGAFWAIGVLALIMLASSSYHIPEVFTGLVSGVLIAGALGHSMWVKRNR